ncbi:MAG: stage II sporulation protein M [Tissierellia bacterium]|nr:stage II sporulation protein M [Tissierellia bacterium]
MERNQTLCLWGLLLFAIAHLVGQIITYHTGMDGMYQIMEFFKNKTEGKTALENFLIFLFNNGRMIVLTMLLGLIPYLFLGILPLLINGLLFGGIYQVMVVAGEQSLWQYILTIGPHGLFELLGLVYMAAVSIKTSWHLGQKLRRQCAISMKELFLRLFASCVFVTMPIIVLSAMIEAYITPLILK